MDSSRALQLMSDLLLTAAKVGAPLLLTILVIGLVVSILQVATQVQEMTLTYVPKLIGIVLVCLVLGAWMLGVLVEYARSMFMNIANF
jgi:flagellar biosynthetic protein FliQ